MKGKADMKSWLQVGKRTGLVRMICLLVVLVVMEGAGAVFELRLASANGNSASSGLKPIVVSPTAPLDNTLGLSATSGVPGTHVFIVGSGYTPGETVQPFWNYSGPGTGTIQ